MDTAQKALDALAASGIRIGKSTYAEYESGAKTPSRNHLPLLESFWGPPEPLEATETPDGVLAAIRAQTELVSALLGELQAERQARVAWEQGFLDAMRELAKAAAPQADPAPALPEVAHP